MIVIGIQYFHEKLCEVLLLDSLLIIALVKGIETEGIHSLRIPDTQGIYHIISITYYRQIAGYRAHALVTLLNEMILSLFIYFDVHISAELYDLRVLRTAKLKGVAVLQPLVRNLYLIAILDLLLEHSLTITDAAALSRISQTRQ